jgi:acyl-CoA synthetase (AMP-forming)/AMP-acid ligase II
VFLCIPPLYHTGAKMHWFGSLMTGGKAVLLRGVKPEWILRAVTEEKCTIVWLLVPWAQDILDEIDAGKIKLGDYLLDPAPSDAHRRAAGSRQSHPPLDEVFPAPPVRHELRLSESTGPGCVHLGVENIPQGRRDRRPRLSLGGEGRR